MRKVFSAIIVILLVSLSALIYFSCGKNSGANNWDLENDNSNISLTENLPVSLYINTEAESTKSIAELKEINVSEINGEEIKIISDINDWQELGFNKDDQHYIFLDAFLKGDSEKLEEMCRVEKGLYNSYKTIKISDYTIQTQSNPWGNPDDIVINMTITDSEVETGLSPGKYSYIVEAELMTRFKPVETIVQKLSPPQEVLRKWFLLGYYDLCRDFSDKEQLRKYSYAVFDFMQMEINEDYPSPDINGWTLDAIKKAVKEYFYLDDFDAEYISEENGIYSIGAHGGAVRIYDFIGEPETDGDIIKVTVQFYADPSKTVKSHTIVYTLVLKNGIYRFADSERIYDSPFKPYGFQM